MCGGSKGFKQGFSGYSTLQKEATQGPGISIEAEALRIALSDLGDSDDGAGLALGVELKREEKVLNLSHHVGAIEPIAITLTRCESSLPKNHFQFQCEND